MIQTRIQQSAARQMFEWRFGGTLTTKPSTIRFLLAVSIAVLSQAPVSIVFGQGGSASDCGPTAGMRSHPRTGVMFRGTVTASRPVSAGPTERNAGLDGSLVTFRVDRVWKGPVYRETVIYQVMMFQMSLYAPGDDVPDRMAPQPYRNAVPFELGKEYLVTTTVRDPLDPRDLERFKFDGFVFGSSSQCYTWPTDLKSVDKALRGASGEPPLERR
jgi:hypothetical protein